MKKHQQTSGKHAFLSKLLLLLTLSLINLAASSQGLYNNSSLHLEGATMYVDGEIVNAGLVVNDGLVGVTYDWSNQGIYKGSGTLEVYGNTHQRISHHEKVQRLVVKGWGTKFIRGRLDITNELHLLQGIVNVSEENELNLSENTTITGGSPESYVEGAITVAGTGYKFFPLGKNGIYAPIEFLDIKGSPARFSVEVFEDAPAITVENAIVKRGLYWQRKDLIGAFGGSAVAIEFDPAQFVDISKMIMVAGSDWNTTFMAIKEVEQSQEKEQLFTRSEVLSPIIMLGEISEMWAGADFYFSTALSPKASDIDNRNAKIFGQRLDDKHFRLEVFNRWGAIVYETTSLQSMQASGWDGRDLNGEYLVTGPYPYRLIAYDKTGKRLEKKGVISIIN